MTTPTLRLGTRGDPAALFAASTVAGGLVDAYEGLEVATVVVPTAGTGTAALDRALLAGTIDAAVHRLRDLAGDEPAPDGVTTGAYLPRDDVHDCVVTREGSGRIDGLSRGARVGAGSVRRAAHLARHFADLRVVPIGGEPEERLDALDSGRFDALVMSVAGLHRIGAVHRIGQILDLARMAPSVGAGITVVRTRADDTIVYDAVTRLHHRPTEAAAFAERTLLARLGGHAGSPVTAHATVVGKRLTLQAAVYTVDGHRWLHAAAEGHRVEAALIGAWVAGDLLAAGARDLIDRVPGPGRISVGRPTGGLDGTRPTVADFGRSTGGSRRSRARTTGR